MYYFEFETKAGTTYSIENGVGWISYNSGMSGWERVGMLIDLKNDYKYYHIRNGEAFFAGDGRWQSTPTTVEAARFLGFRRYNGAGHLFNIFMNPSEWTQVSNLNVQPLELS